MPSGVYQHKKGIHHHSEKTKRKIGLSNTISNKGKHSSPETEFKKGMVADEKNPQWKGDDVKYTGLHMWLYRKLGKPTKCEHCGKDGLTGKQIHWANVSGEYKRDLKDWIRLCSKCHGKYDALHGHKKGEKELDKFSK